MCHVPKRKKGRYLFRVMPTLLRNYFQQVYTFLETLYISNRLVLPLKGITLIGY